jgi:hypothetical protein
VTRRRKLPLWQPMGMYQLTVSNNGASMSVIVMQMGAVFSVSAVEASLGKEVKLTLKGVSKAMRQGFDDHKHDVVGSFATEERALNAGDKYARAWLEGGMEKARCTCKKIGS